MHKACRTESLRPGDLDRQNQAPFSDTQHWQPRDAVVRCHYSPRGGGTKAQVIRLGVHRQCGRSHRTACNLPRFYQT